MIKVLTPLNGWKEIQEGELEQFILFRDRHSPAIKYEDKIAFLNSKLIGATCEKILEKNNLLKLYSKRGKIK